MLEDREVNGTETEIQEIEENDVEAHALEQVDENDVEAHAFERPAFDRPAEEVEGRNLVD